MITFAKSSILFPVVASAVTAIVASQVVQQVQANPLSGRSDPSLSDTPLVLAEDSGRPYYIPVSKKIVGGTQSIVGDYPYFVEMGGCGGALIGPDLVLFAAHCGDWTNKQVNIGAYERRTENHGSEARFCDRWEAHPDFGKGGSKINNDFALCKLDKPVYIDESLVALELNRGSISLKKGEELIVMGLGGLAQNAAGPQFIHNVTVPVIPNGECNSEDSYNNGVTSAMFCAGYPKGGQDSCQGDSGGPIVKRVYNRDTGKFVDHHVGIVSWGQGCALPNKPGVYARTSSAISFIDKTACKTFESIASFCNNNNNNNNDLPTTPPEPSCEDDAVLNVEVTTDIYGSETAWSLTDRHSRGTLIKRKYLLNFNDNQHSVCVQKNRCYTFEITDDYGDGMCTSQGGCGAYELSLKGETFYDGNGAFSKVDTKEFCVNGEGKAVSVLPPSPAPVAAPTHPPAPMGDCGGNTALQFQMTLRIDDYGGETKWIMSEIDPNTFDPNDVKTGSVYDSRADPTDFEAFALYTYPEAQAGAEENGYSNSSPSYYYCLKENACYLYEIFDDYGDGLVGGKSKGFYRGTLEGGEVFAGADFKKYEFKTFCTGNAYIPSVALTTAPTEAPTKPTMSPSVVTQPTGDVECVDQVEVELGKKKKKCSWAGKGSLRARKRKCRKKTKTKQKVCDVCPETCGKMAGVGKCKALFAGAGTGLD